MQFAQILGVSQTFIGLTLVAIGTSLPELATACFAAAKRQGNLALGNVLGSNVFNLLGVLGAASLVRVMPVPAQIIRQDLWVMILATFALVWAALLRPKMTRRTGAVFLAGYGGYLALLVALAP